MLRLRVMGVPLDIRWSWLVFALVFGVLIHGVDPILVPWVVLATIAVLVHEAGHAAVVLASGGSPRVTLHGSGGMTAGPRVGARETFVLAAAGPAAGFVFGGLLLGLVALLPPTAVPTQLVDDLVLVSIGWSSLNLLPLAGLDGRLALDSLVMVLLGRPAPGVGRLVSAFLLVALLLATALAGQYYATFLVGFIALVTALPLGASGGSNDGPGYLMQGRASEALAWANARLVRHPGDIETTLIRAHALRYLTRWSEAIDAYDVVLRQRPASWHALLGRSLARRFLGQLTEARIDRETLLEAATSDPDAIAAAALALWGDHRYTEAARLLDHALTAPAVSRPLQGQLSVLRAMVHSVLAEPELAVAMTDQRLADAPDDIAAHEVRAQALLQLGRTREATASAQRALAGAPRHPELLETMAIVERFSGDPETALPRLIDAAAARPHLPRALAELAACFVQLGRLSEATIALGSLDEIGSADPYVSYARACQLARTGSVSDASAALRRAADVVPALGRIADQDPVLRDLSRAAESSIGPARMALALPD